MRYHLVLTENQLARHYIPQRAARRAARPLVNRQGYATAAAPNSTQASSFDHWRPTDVGIVGGGITALSAAFAISQSKPEVNITIYEATNRLGGWIQSKRVDVDGGGSVLFELGPSSLRTQWPDAAIMQYLVSLRVTLRLQAVPC
jgi:protoporphyrinogen/coproporphyrinogen III oxidase